MTDPFVICEETVRRRDPDRFFAGLFAPQDKRRHLYVLAALYYELAHAVEAAREPMLAAIRLMWWRETVELARQGTARPHSVAQALVETLAQYDLSADAFEAMIAAREAGGESFGDAAAAEGYADATIGTLMRLSTRVLGVDADEAVRAAGIAYGLAGRREAVFAKIDVDALARTQWQRLRGLVIPRAALPALLPAALVPLYLKRADPPLWRKQIALVLAARRGRL